jgi:hypothetical protein
MTHWNANNYSKQMAKDIKKIRARQRLQQAILNESIPPTPNEENPMLALSRVNSKPTLFSLARTMAGNREQQQGLASSPVSSPADRDRGQPNQRRNSSFTSSKSADNLNFSSSAAAVSVHTSPPPSTDTLTHQQTHLRSSSFDIHRIQEENSAALAQVNNSPVQYPKSIPRHETE